MLKNAYVQFWNTISDCLWSFMSFLIPEMALLFWDGVGAGQLGESGNTLVLKRVVTSTVFYTEKTKTKTKPKKASYIHLRILSSVTSCLKLAVVHWFTIIPLLWSEEGSPAFSGLGFLVSKVGTSLLGRLLVATLRDMDFTWRCPSPVTLGSQHAQYCSEGGRENLMSNTANCKRVSLNSYQVSINASSYCCYRFMNYFRYLHMASKQASIYTL